MTVLVTGGSGLVGTHLLDALRARGQPARALVRPESRSTVEAFGAEAIAGDVTDPGVWERAARGVDAIVHAAALVTSRDSLDEYMRVNVGGTRLAIDAAHRAKARLVHVSSVAVYGRGLVPNQRPADEDFPFQPLASRDYYARSKRAAEELVREAGTAGLSTVVIRPNVIYGERDRLFTARLVATISRGVLPRIGRGSNHLSCVYAGNVASAIVAALDAPEVRGFHAYNGTHDAPPAITSREFFAAFARLLGGRTYFIPVPVIAARIGVALWSGVLRLLAPRRYSGLAGAAVTFIVAENPYSSERIRSELGWTPPFDARTAIARSMTQNKSPGNARAPLR